MLRGLHASLFARNITIVQCSFFYCRHLSSVLGNKFDHGAEAIMPTIFNLIPNSAKIMATSGVVAVRLIIRVSIFWSHRCKKQVVNTGD